MRGHIVVCGVDETLLNIRRDVLLSVGFNVTTTARPEDLLQLAQDQTVRVLVLCHTLKAAEQQLAIRVLGSQWPSAKSIILTTLYNQSPSEVPDAFVHTSEGPKALIATLEQLLATDSSDHS